MGLHDSKHGEGKGVFHHFLLCLFQRKEKSEGQGDKEIEAKTKERETRSMGLPNSKHGEGKGVFHLPLLCLFLTHPTSIHRSGQPTYNKMSIKSAKMI